MAAPDGPQAQFSARLGRRLGLTVAGIVIGFLLVGGLSIVLTRNVARLHRLVDQERLHIKAVDDIGAAFHHLIFEIQQGQIARSGTAQDALAHYATLIESLKNFRDLHRQEEGLPEDGQERASFAALWETAAALRPLAESIASESPLAPRLDPQQWEHLSLIGHQIPGRVAMLSQAHQARVTHLLAASDKVQRAILILYIATFCIGGIVVAVAGRVFHARIAAPLRTLAAAARRIADGEQPAQVPVPSADEIGSVSHAFNIMAESLALRERELTAAQDRLRQKLHQMEALNQIGSGMLHLSGSSGRDAILRSIAERARDLLSVDVSAMCLATTSPEALVVHSTSGPAEAFRLREGIAHFPAACGPQDQHTIADCPVIRPEFARSHLAMPLQYGGESRGVLCVAAREERVFGAEAIELLTALAAQAAIALEHFRLDSEVQRLAVLEERGRIAREMHDGLAQSVSLLHLRIRETQAKVPPEQFSPLGNALEEMATISGDMYEEIRRSISGLRIPASQEAGFVPALRGFLKEFSAQTRLPVEFTAEGVETVRLSPASESQAIRIVQEALNNVRRHAQADRARVLLECKNGCLRVSVQDDGRGFDSAQFITPDGFHFGLRGMRERAEGLGGTLEIVTAPRKGTCVMALLPLEKLS